MTSEREGMISAFSLAVMNMKFQFLWLVWGVKENSNTTEETKKKSIMFKKDKN